MPILYQTTATAIAGREGRVRSIDGTLDLALRIPKEMGGPGGPGSDPEQLFAAGYSACFHSALLFIARQTKADTSGSSVTGTVGVGPKDDGTGFQLAVTLAVTLPALALTDANTLVSQAHKVCPYSNAVRGNIEVVFNVQAK